MCCNHGRDALGCGCGMFCMLQGSREYILARLSRRGSVAASEKAGTGNGGAFLWLESEFGDMAVSPKYKTVFCDLGENICSLCARKACAGVLNRL